MSITYLRAWRRLKGYSVREAAKLTGVPPMTFSTIERGVVPKYTTATRIANAIGCSVEELYGDANKAASKKRKKERNHERD